jgi:hypothetical protein
MYRNTINRSWHSQSYEHVDATYWDPCLMCHMPDVGYDAGVIGFWAERRCRTWGGATEKFRYSSRLWLVVGNLRNLTLLSSLISND